MIKQKKLQSPYYFFILYMISAFILIMIFRFIYPGIEAPLEIFSKGWRGIHGLLTFFNLFPALSFAALVIPFGFAVFEEFQTNFSQIFLKRLAPLVIIAICAAVVYSIILFLISPLVTNYEENIRLKGEIYQVAQNKVQDNIDTGQWHEALQYLNICESIWPNNPKLTDAKIDIGAGLSRIELEGGRQRAAAHQALVRDPRSAPVSMEELQERPLLTATDAISLGEAAFREGRFYDAHWLAVMGERLSVRGSAQAANAARLAGRAWNQIESLAPSQLERNLYSLYYLKRSGYQAMNSGNWIQAYYIFLDIISKTPDDLDVVKFLAESEKKAQETAFFTDEMVFLGNILTGAIFSLPEPWLNEKETTTRVIPENRVVFRFLGLSAFQDYAYGWDIEYMKFDENSRLVTGFTAKYAKLLPFSVEDKPKVLIMTHALDRHNKDLNWNADFHHGRMPPGGIILDISFEDFIELLHVRHGLKNLKINELFSSAQKFGNAGYVSRIFEAEALNRLGTAIFFLPMSIFVIIIGWRFRTKIKPRYLFIPMLFVLPLVFHAFVFLYRSIFNTLGIWLVLSYGFSLSLIVFIILLVLSFFLSLVILASQKK